MKMKMPKISFNAKKICALATRVARFTASGDMEFDEMSEPNMKLSRALLIVLVLHVVAVAGIIAFNAIKSRGRGWNAGHQLEPHCQVLDQTIEEAKATQPSPAKIAKKSKNERSNSGRRESSYTSAKATTR